MRTIALATAVLLSLVLASTASAGIVPSPGDYCTQGSVCHCILGYTFDPFPLVLEMIAGYNLCAVYAMNCLSQQFVVECILG